MDDGRDDESEDVYPDEYDGPRVRIPSVDVPGMDVSTPDSDVIADSPIAALFVLHVIIWNAVLLLFSLGVMLIYFERNWTTGGQLIAVSVVLTLYGVYRWPDNVGVR
jgi:hypothetical protein